MLSDFFSEKLEFEVKGENSAYFHAFKEHRILIANSNVP